MKAIRIIHQLFFISILTFLYACGGGSSDNSTNDEPTQVEPDLIVVYGLELDKGMLQPAFDSTVSEYNATLAYTTSSIKIKPFYLGGSLTVNGTPIVSEEAPATISLTEGNNLIEVVGTSADGSNSVTYTLNLLRQPLDEYAQSTFIKASDTGQYDRFGDALALDGNTMVVGARRHGAPAVWNENVDDIGNGAVYVFVYENEMWRQQALLETNTEGNDNFGSSVAIEGDTIVIGALIEDSASAGVGGDEADNSLKSSGAAYVYQRQGDIWTKQAYLKASYPSERALFGASVAISGDTIAVGAYRESSGSSGIDGSQNNTDKPSSGAVYIFTRNNTTWAQEAYIKASNSDENDNFGYSVALDGDTLAVGADREKSLSTGINGDDSDNSATNSGAVYIFERTSNIWQQTAYIKPSNTNEDQLFGMSVVLQGDTLAVTAPWEDGASTGVNGEQDDSSKRNSGAVYVFIKTANEWRQQAYIKASNSYAMNAFGHGRNSLALDGNRMLVGAMGENSRSSGVNGDESDNAIFQSSGDSFYHSIGAAYLFEFVEEEWRQIAYLKPSNPTDRIGFGGAVALNQDFLIVGGPDEKTRGTGVNAPQSTFDSFDIQFPSDEDQGAGAVYVYSGN